MLRRRSVARHCRVRERLSPHVPTEELMLSSRVF
jgi:hypothetical protein